VTLDEICRQVSDKSALSDASGSPERTFLERACNEGIRQVLLDTRCKVTAVEISLTAGTAEYDLTDYNILATVDYINVDDNRRTLSNVNTGEVLARNLWGSTGSARRFSILGDDLLIVNPTPADDDTFTFYAVVQPDLITDGGTDLADDHLPAYAQKAVEWWMMIEASQKNRDPQGIDYYTSLYEKEVIKVRKRARWVAGRRMATPKIGYPDHPNVVPARNDFDTGF
jgi:hypothetical protein